MFLNSEPVKAVSDVLKARRETIAVAESTNLEVDYGIRRYTFH